MDDHDSHIVMGLKDPWKFLFVDMDIAMAAACCGFLLLTMGLPTPVVVGGGGALGYLFAMVQHRDAVTQAHDELDVMLDQQHGAGV